LAIFGTLFGMFFSTLFGTTIAKEWIATFASSLAMTEGGHERAKLKYVKDEKAKFTRF
jgi:hypothetical protein